MTTQANILEQSTQHLNEEELSAFVANPSSNDFAALRLHIANCPDCREKTQKLQNSQNIVKAFVETISTQPASDLKARLHATTHELAMSKLAVPVEPQASNPKTQKKKAPWLSNILQAKIHWFALPATAMASVLAAWILLAPPSAIISGESNNQSQLVSFQDTQGLIFQKQPQPGLGFFHQSDQQVQPYSGFEIKLNPDKGTVAIKWPKINGVTRYQISLQEVSNNVSTELTSTQTEGTMWQAEQSLLSPGTLYRLHLSGRTDSELSFHYSGGFVFQ